MAKKGGAGENSKKAAGQARKAEQAATKAAAENAKKAAVEDAEWEQGAKKGNAKKASAEEKKAEAAKKKAERDALLAEEEANTPGRAAPKNAKSAAKKTRGIDAALGEVDAPLSELNATGIENALDALGLVDEKRQDKIDRHPERRKWKYAAWKERRLEEMKADKDEWAQRKKYMHAIEAELWKEWKNSPENPMNQVHAAYNSTQQDISALRSHVDEATENRLAAK